MTTTTKTPELLAEAAKAEKLESAGLYRRAARQWLSVFDLAKTDEDLRHFAFRRKRCLALLGRRYYPDYNSIKTYSLQLSEDLS